MDVVEAIATRRSIRCFKPDPVPETILREIVGAALRAPSASNSQPWEMAIVSGARLEKIKRAFLDNASRPPCLDIPVSGQYPEPWASRRAAVMSGMLGKLGISREDRAARAEWGLSAYRLWGGPPSCIYLMLERSFYCARRFPKRVEQFHFGLITQDILLLATERRTGYDPGRDAGCLPRHTQEGAGSLGLQAHRHGHRRRLSRHSQPGQ